MFQPFENVAQFYPGLILWCDPGSYDMEATTLPPGTPFDRKKTRELRPCLVVAVNQTTQMIQVARLCATVPTDARRWVRVDTAPPITWKLPDAWIWVGTPATVKMVLHNTKAMHPHKDVYYTTSPVAAANLQNYWIHRQNYLNLGASGSAGVTNTYNTNISPYHTSPAPGSTLYSTSNPNNPMQSAFNPGSPQANYNQGYFGYPNSNPSMNPGMNPHTHPYVNTSNMIQNQAQSSYIPLAPQPGALPAGFTETHPSRPGWWRNPETGEFWHAERGLLPPPGSRG
ncbi:hypothetical protein B0H19DRAFT_1374906 [Mycena capillaripes]|nr:hypothetical protein B0H19DRAFT_1374906 [Mycena capillaripes]